jgi:hypothetical protein
MGSISDASYVIAVRLRQQGNISSWRVLPWKCTTNEWVSSDTLLSYVNSYK